MRLPFIEIIYGITQYFRGETVPGWASTLSVMSFLFGILFILLGIIICTYIARIHHSSLQSRPRFIIEQSLSNQRE